MNSGLPIRWRDFEIFRLGLEEMVLILNAKKHKNKLLNYLQGLENASIYK